MAISFTNNTIGEPFIVLNQVSSTNNYAMEQLKNELSGHGAAYFAEEQVLGKGQRNKHWVAEKGKNILLSVILETDWLKVADLFKISVVAAIASYDFFSRYAGEETFIKWPNDIYWGDRKAGGILVENIVRGNLWQFAVLGIGININQVKFEADLPNPVSMKQITGKDFIAIDLAKELCGCIEQRLYQLKANQFDDLLNFYNSVLYKKGKMVRLRKGNAILNCCIKEVNIFGQLITEGGAQEIFNFGEVDWVMD